ncbi:SDR family oxidoreductase [Mycobacterium aquaticum]|uniref:Short chain dehydrogenase n=1 Tax=Mycobacterium aquaticum TaxID=1927124 RepID=A0A1X0B123_9MYCO|nr:SDR family oxidoreductase [Mycobacterium aquaticum]ORA35905.1 short chain dehydrogenase [Mycobacterium aquaticum]
MTFDPQGQVARRIILVTGASRGIGAEVARQLTGPDVHVIINYREKHRRAEAIANEIIAAGGSASIAAADISNPVDCAHLIDLVERSFGRLDALVLNASGGLELGAAADYPMRINRDAPVRLTRSAMTVMPAGSRIVFVTSHQAHFHGAQPVPADYVPIAESKRAGEDALRAMSAEFDGAHINFTVVSGDMIDGTIIVQLLQRRDPTAVESRRAHGALPTVEQFASAIVAAVNTTVEDDTIYVGGSDYLTS